MRKQQQQQQQPDKSSELEDWKIGSVAFDYRSGVFRCGFEPLSPADHCTSRKVGSDDRLLQSATTALNPSVQILSQSLARLF